MRYPALALSNCFRALIAPTTRLFGPSRGLWVGVLCAAAALSAATATTPARADEPPSDVPVNITLTLATLDYIVIAQQDNSEELEALRKFILWCIWRLGGNPYELDPYWTPPIGGNP